MSRKAKEYPIEQPICAVEGCNSKRAKKGGGQYRRYCSKHHYKRERRKDYLPPGACREPGCNEITIGERWYCELHRQEHLLIQRQETRIKGKARYDKSPAFRAKRSEYLAQWRSSLSPEKKEEVKASAIEWRSRPENQEKRKKRNRERKERACFVCGWDESRCDKHRIVPGELGGGYCQDNVLVLCPCCHRVAHLEPKLFKQKIIAAVLGGFEVESHLLAVARGLVRLREASHE